MNQIFNSILDFTKVRTHCVFCQFPLVAELSNYSGVSIKKIPRFNAQLIDNCFAFHLEFCSLAYEINTDGYLHADTGKLEFNSKPHIGLEVFLDSSPYISLNCNNPICKMNYYAASKILTVDEYTVKRVHFVWEAFNYKKLWIQNDWITMKTLIYSTVNQDALPIKQPLIDFRFIEKEKLLTRIETLVIFS